MDEPARCPRCGARRPASSPGGHCPQCLLLLGFGDVPGGIGEDTMDDLPRGQGDPERIGPYRVLEKIGEGGLRSRAPGNPPRRGAVDRE